FAGFCRVAVAITKYSSLPGCRLAGYLLFARRVDLPHHLLHPAANLFAVLAELYRFPAQRLGLFFPIPQLLLQTLHVPLSRHLCLARGLVHLNSAINLVFQRLEIVGRNLSRYLVNRFQSHNSLLPERNFRTCSQYTPTLTVPRTLLCAKHFALHGEHGPANNAGSIYVSTRHQTCSNPIPEYVRLHRLALRPWRHSFAPWLRFFSAPCARFLGGLCALRF